jgi:arylsulfatase A-like enzyme
MPAQMRKVVAVLVLLVALIGAWYELRWRRPPPAIDLSHVAVAPASPAVEHRPNVVLVIGCSVRADQLTPTDPRLETTPFLKKLSDEGVRFTDTIAQAPWTKPAVTAIVTGLEPLATGIPDPGDGVNTRVLAADNVTLAERLHDVGYTTVGLTGNPNINTTFGFDQGFDVYVDTPNLWRDIDAKVDGGQLVDDALDVVRRLRSETGQKPLYLQILFVDAHFPATGITDAELERFPGISKRMSQYRAMLRRLDGHVEALFSGLQEQGVERKDLVFVFVGDHGDGLYYPGPQHGIGHGNFLYDSTVGVPWIVWGLDLRPNTRVGGASAQVDLVPTLLDLLGIDGSGYRGPGLDLAPAIRAQNRAARRVDPGRRVFTDTWFRASNRAAIYTRTAMCQKNFGKPDDDFPDGCFDRAQDPAMKVPGHDDALTEELVAWRALRFSAFQERGDKAEADLAPDLVRQLKALGYVE